MGPPRPPGRAVQVGPQHRDRPEGKPVHRGGGIRPPGAEVPADVTPTSQPGSIPELCICDTEQNETRERTIPGLLPVCVARLQPATRPGLRRCVAYRLDVVAVGIEHEGAVVVRMIVRPDA